jgi:hypothetical protein
MIDELQTVVAYWLNHPWRFVAFYMLVAFVDGFARAAGRDLFTTWQARRRNR